MTDNLPHFISADAIANSGFAGEASKMLQQHNPHVREAQERTVVAARSSLVEEEIAHLTRMKQCLDG